MTTVADHTTPEPTGAAAPVRADVHADLPQDLPPDLSQDLPAEVDAAAARFYLALGRLARIVRRSGDGDLGPGTFSALATLAQLGPMRLGDLAAREGVAPPTLTRIVAALEESGLVVRETDPADRRAVRVAATPDGAALTAGVRTARSAALRDRMLALPRADLDVLLAAVPVLEALVGDEG
ncbi:MarR family winged helix-turn-helix transcriptional regulator [Kineosporia sp. R_H_3]|uniref:MarR family winged helix-turn-helix transcriptional regulator n=1 Tax=Kineosporia sp. R_H_3 TaxID=1961848 RepID=UPI000B4B712D|nr:MarR family transcriptional regulator [Kineosporia sp. R_H_3]